MKDELTLSLVATQLSPTQKNMVDENVIREINLLAHDSSYGPEFLDTYLDHLQILKNYANRGHPHYLNAVKFFSLVESGNNLVNSYIKVFPDRWQARCDASGEERAKEMMRHEASRFNKTSMVNDIRQIAGVPVQLIHRHLLHEAILETANLMKNARSEMVRQKAAATLIMELKPSEEQTLNIKVDDGSSSVIEALRLATEALAIQEHQSVMAGVPMKQIAEATIIEAEIEELDG